MGKHELEGTIPLGPTLGSLPQIGADVENEITANVDGMEITLKFSSLSQSDFSVMPSTLKVVVSFSDDHGVSSRQRAFDLLVDASQNVLDMIRVTQPTTGLPGTLPNFTNVVFRRDASVEPLGFDWRQGYRPVAMIIRPEELRPHANDFKRAVQRELNDDWDLDILISQARHYAQMNWDSNPSLSMFLAALVLETKMKRVLWRNTPSEMQEALLQVVPETAPLKCDVLMLFSSVATKYLGRSLKKEKPKLWPVVRKIFEDRNQFAHQAVHVTRDEANDAVRCARRVMLWLYNGAQQNYRH